MPRIIPAQQKSCIFSTIPEMKTRPAMAFLIILKLSKGCTNFTTDSNHQLMKRLLAIVLWRNSIRSLYMTEDSEHCQDIVLTTLAASTGGRATMY